MDNASNHHWLSFRLQSLLIVVLVVAIPLAWLARQAEWVRQRRETLTLHSGWDFDVEWEGPPDDRYVIGWPFYEPSYGRMTLTTNRPEAASYLQWLFPESQVIVRPDVGVSPQE